MWSKMLSWLHNKHIVVSSQYKQQYVRMIYVLINNNGCLVVSSRWYLMSNSILKRRTTVITSIINKMSETFVSAKNVKADF